MLILTHLPFSRARSLSEVVGSDHRVVSVDSWADLLERTEALRPHVAVVDPTPAPAQVPVALDAIASVVASVPVLLYTPLTPAAARAVQSLRDEPNCLWILEGIDDDPPRLRALLERYRRLGNEEALLVPVLAALRAARSDPALLGAIRELFRTPASFHTARDLARVAGVSLRWLNASLQAAGLASAGMLVAAARVLAAFDSVLNRDLTIGQIAAQLRYRDVKSLRRQAVAFTGVVPSAWPTELTAEACVSRLAARLGVRPDRPLVLVRSATRE
jgi:AraC-like DNA-binding protein